MALARVKTWIAGELLKAADLNGEFNNILNNPISLVSPTTGAINFNLQSHTNMIPSALSGTSGSTGQVLVISAAGTPVWGAAGAGALIGAGSRVKGLSGTISSQTGTFAADQYILQTTSGTHSFVLNSTAPFSVSVGTAGPAAGGRDVAAVFASTSVHWYVITTGLNSTTPAGIVSSQAPPTGPAMPTNYSAWAYLGGSVYTSASTTVAQDHRFLGSKAFLDGITTPLSSGTATAETAVSLTTAIPSNALSYDMNTFFTILSSAAATFFDITPRLRVVSGSDFVSNRYVATSAGGSSLTFTFMSANFPNVSNQFLYLITIATATSAALSAKISSYTMPNGDA